MKATIPEGQFRKADYSLFPTLVQVWNLNGHSDQKLVVDTINSFTQEILMLSLIHI